MPDTQKEYQSKDVSVAQRQIYILSLLSENPNGYQADEIRERLGTGILPSAGAPYCGILTSFP